MGWSIALVKPKLDELFENLEMRYDILHPDSMSPMIYITYDESVELPANILDKIIRYFPDFVYVDIKPMHFPSKGEAEG